MKPTTSETVFSLTALAHAVGLATWEVRELESAGFGAPRDRRWNGREDVYTEHGVELLVQELHARGDDARALALREAWTARVVAEEPWYQRGQMA